MSQAVNKKQTESLEIKALQSPETSVSSQQTTRHYVPQDLFTLVLTIREQALFLPVPVIRGLQVIQRM